MSKRSIHESLDPSRITYADAVSREAVASCRLDGETQVAVAMPHVEPDMNKTEAAYAKHLDAMQKAGEIRRWWFQPVKMRLADKTFYTPDFLVLNETCHLSFHEVKGFLRDDASVKFKVAKSMYPIFGWCMVKKIKGGEWDIREMPW